MTDWAKIAPLTGILDEFRIDALCSTNNQKGRRFANELVMTLTRHRSGACDLTFSNAAGETVYQGRVHGMKVWLGKLPTTDEEASITSDLRNTNP